ncbi:hypothetical protein [Nonomuraea rubra]|uniref:Uncharacterized protein n=1 Tax=Nonomuraea rubra TaxID=46180 RepID=A0A7X0U6J2_9ACTN|nr:hypothetical protein [Nonomuraea rubra]MBB6556545.1 hypothetical protein [Nonomuraea rubra]
MAAAGADKAAKEPGKAIEEAAEDFTNLAVINWKWNSVKTFGHTFSDHGKSVAQLADRVLKKGKPKGRWTDHDSSPARIACTEQPFRSLTNGRGEPAAALGS